MAKSSSESVSSVFSKPLQLLMIRFMYVVLLIAFLVIGYLLGKLQTLENGGATATATQGAQEAAGTQAGDTTAPAGEEAIFAEVDNGHLPVKGDPNAPITIVEFSDFECPFCGQFYSGALPEIEEEYVDSGQVKIYYRHLPLDFHPQARPAALASECANEQDSFWAYHDTLFDNQNQLSGADTQTYVDFATDLGLNADQFRTCLESEKYADNVDEDAQAASAAQANGTPTFYINGQQIVGAQPFSSFQAIIDQELEG